MLIIRFAVVSATRKMSNETVLSIHETSRHSYLASDRVALWARGERPSPESETRKRDTDHRRAAANPGDVGSCSRTRLHVARPTATQRAGVCHVIA